MKYKIGDVAKFLGISPDLLRYYEKKGVVHPEKGRSNDYRYYDTWDMNFLVDCLWYKGFGFGIDQIAQMVTASSYSELIGIMAEKEADIYENLRLQELLLSRTREYLDEMRVAQSLLGTCSISESPEIVRYLNRYNFIYDESPDVQQLAQQWLRYIPFTHRCFDVEQDVVINGGNDYAWGFSLGMQYVKEFNILTEPPVLHLPPQTCVHSVFTSSGKNNFTPRLMDYMVNWANENGWTVCGNARGHLLCSALEDNELTGFFEAWIPVSRN